MALLIQYIAPDSNGSRTVRWDFMYVVIDIHCVSAYIVADMMSNTWWKKACGICVGLVKYILVETVCTQNDILDHFKGQVVLKFKIKDRMCSYINLSLYMHL